MTRLILVIAVLVVYAAASQTARAQTVTTLAPSSQPTVIVSEHDALVPLLPRLRPGDTPSAITRAVARDHWRTRRPGGSRTEPARIEAEARSGGNADVFVRQLPRMNHLFQTARTGLPDEYSTIEETIATHALNLISEWIEQRIAARHP